MASAILFDFNGVIIDDEPQHCEALIATLAEYGYPLDRETYYRDYLGFDDRECFRFTFAREGDEVDERRIAEAIERKNGHYERAIRADMRLVPGRCRVRRGRGARWGHRLAIVSGALRREIELVLELAGLRAALRRDRRGGGRERLQARSAGLSTGPARRSGVRCRPAASSSRIPCPGSPRRARPACAAPCSRPRTPRTPAPAATWSGATSSAGRRAICPGPMADARPDDRPRAPRAGAARARRWCWTIPRSSGSPGRARSPASRACFTNDLEKPGDGSLVYGAMLTPKGMIVVDAWVAPPGRARSRWSRRRRAATRCARSSSATLPPRLAKADGR